MQDEKLYYRSVVPRAAVFCTLLQYDRDRETEGYILQYTRNHQSMAKHDSRSMSCTSWPIGCWRDYGSRNNSRFVQIGRVRIISPPVRPIAALEGTVAIAGTSVTVVKVEQFGGAVFISTSLLIDRDGLRAPCRNVPGRLK